jgi:hypothetical protein
MKIMKINEGQRGAGGNYNSPRLLTASESAITWQSTETPYPFAAESKMSHPPATRADAQQRTSNPATVSCRTRQTHSAAARKYWHDKRSAQHSTARAPL